MNDSGQAASTVRHHNIEDSAELVVVHESSTCPSGAEGEGGRWTAGQRAAPIVQHPDDVFACAHWRGQAPSKEYGADHVLSPPSKRERTELDIVVQEAADAVELIVTDGIAPAMNRYNTVAEPDP
jgi:PTH1 family peptidyl-tRNA hydrolase